VCAVVFISFSVSHCPWGIETRRALFPGCRNKSRRVTREHLFLERIFRKKWQKVEIRLRMSPRKEKAATRVSLKVGETKHAPVGFSSSGKSGEKEKARVLKELRVSPPQFTPRWRI